jgi:uncharacterized protein (DUF433 family)
MPSVKNKKQEVTLIAPHTHGGKPCKKGAKISVTESQIQWLKKRNLIEDKD